MRKNPAALIVILLAIIALAFWYVSRSSPSIKTQAQVETQSAQAVDTQAVATSTPPAVSAPLDSLIYHVPQTVNPNGLNLVFFSDGYVSWGEFDSDVQMFYGQIKQVEPFKSYNRFNIYEIMPKELSVCTLVKETKPVLRCDPVAVNNYLSPLQLARFKFVILSRQQFQSWSNIVRFDNSVISFSIPQSPTSDMAAKVFGWEFDHLLGHTFGLKDEELYVITKGGSNGTIPDGPNCAPDMRTAEQWWGKLAQIYPSRVGYFPGCEGNNNFIKPTKGSLMALNESDSDFVPDFGPVSELYLSKVLNYCFSDKTYSISDDPDFFAQYPDFKACVQSQ